MEMSVVGSNSSSTSLNIETDSVTSNGKKALKEGAVQLTSLSTLLSHHRYFFLYYDTLIVSKQKGTGSFKLKEKLRLEKVWIASSNTLDSFLIGWPLSNYLVHFRNREEKEDWFELLSHCIQQCLRPLFTTISMDINVRGRKQVIRRRIENGKKSGELVLETAGDLGLQHTSYELRLIIGDNSGKALQGPENVYVAIMAEIEKNGIRLSDSQKQSLDTCPIASARLVLSNIKSTKSPSPMQIVNSIKKRVLHRSDSRSFFGKELDGPTPPQPIMTIVDHLRMQGYDTEGIFRKSPKQSTLKECRSELERGLVPDYHKYSTHVLASVLKDYLRSIPGKILLSGNYELWMKEVTDESDTEKKIDACRNLLSLLPTSHSILLANVLKLLNKIANSPSTKMTATSLSVCLGPSFLESSDPMQGGKEIPPLVEFLIKNAADVVPGFSADSVFSILNPIDYNANHICSPTPTCSDGEDDGSQMTPIIKEMREDFRSQPSLKEEIYIDDIEGSNTHLQSKSEHSETFSFSSDSEDSNDENARATFSRTSFVSATLKTEGCEESGNTLTKETVKDQQEKALSVTKIEDRKPDTPRSPCLKRIHFQRKQEAAQHRTSEIFKYDSRTEFGYEWNAKHYWDDRYSDKKGDDKLEPIVRKESREEATQTADCGLPQIGDSKIRFPAFKSNAMLIEKVTEVPNSPSLLRKESSFYHDPTPRLLDFSSKPIGKDVQNIVTWQEETQKPTVHVHPFTQEPTIKTITERLAFLREHNTLEIQESQRSIRRSNHAQELSHFRRESPRFVKNNIEISSSEGSTVARDLHVLKTNRNESRGIITEKFPSYCLEPKPNNKDDSKKSPRRSDLQRSLSQRGCEIQKTNVTSTQRDLQRASSVKSGRRMERGLEGCIGMDPLEINWSVRQLKTLFQDTRAPYIDTDYNLS